MDTSVKTNIVNECFNQQNSSLSENIPFKKRISVCLTSRNKESRIATSRSSNTSRVSTSRGITVPSVCRTSRNNFSITKVPSVTTRVSTERNMIFNNFKPSVCRTTRNNTEIPKDNTRLSKTTRPSNENSPWYDNVEDYNKNCFTQCKPFIPININFINKADIISKEVTVYIPVRPILEYDKNDYNILDKLEIPKRNSKVFFEKALYVYENNQYCYLAMHEASIISESQLRDKLTDLEIWFSEAIEPKLKLKEEEESRLSREKFKRINGYSYYCDPYASKYLNFSK